MKLFPIIILLFVAIGFPAQTSKKNKSKPAPRKPVKSLKVRTVSLGVINGRAIDLIQPTYPPAARAVNAYGSVSISVTIDETGTVTSAQVLKGHPFLRATAVSAALRSKFEPYKIGKTAVRVNGVIDYHFLPTKWNWLDIGYSLGGGSAYYKLNRLPDLMPGGFGEVATLLRQINGENWDVTVETVLNMTQGKLIEDLRSAWLFDIGVTLAEIRTYCCRVEDVLEEAAHHLKNQLQIVPSGISDDLILKLQRIVFLIDNSDMQKSDALRGSQLYQLLSDMEERYPIIGQ